ncbi:hypothetical protein D9758_014137 [Tetrapyrgos nigripes]|uniref:Uncharacterized protein n=1 Tax=Tetrapyrgos nigripes TaxID=182062 RepID=A0A8H5CMD4_9AGAR|nr:hypothetical protein D9758_014137 [Tetrapyrgos nigripes]
MFPPTSNAFQKQTRSNGESTYIGQQGPQPLEIVAFEEIPRRKVSDPYRCIRLAHSSDGTASAPHANLAALRSLRIVPRLQSIFGRDRELASTRAAGNYLANEQFAALNLEEPAKGAVWNLSLVIDLQPGTGPKSDQFRWTSLRPLTDTMSSHSMESTLVVYYLQSHLRLS